VHTDYIVLLFIHIVKFFASYLMVYTLSYHHTYKQDTNLRLYSVIQTSYPRSARFIIIHFSCIICKMFFDYIFYCCYSSASVAIPWHFLSVCKWVSSFFSMHNIIFSCIFFCIFSFLGLHIIHSSCILDKKRIFIQEDL